MPARLEHVDRAQHVVAASDRGSSMERLLPTDAAWWKTTSAPRATSPVRSVSRIEPSRSSTSHSIEVGDIPRTQIVDDDDLVAACSRGFRDVGPDEPGSPGHDSLHRVIPSSAGTRKDMLEDPEVVAEAGILQPRDAETRPDTVSTSFVPRDLDPISGH